MLKFYYVMWIFVASLAYFINAGVYVSDKFLLSKKLHSSIAYAFYVGMWSIFNFLILPLDFWIPQNLAQFSINLLAGFLFLLAMVVWYKALHQSEATRVVPIVGALTPVFSFILSYIFLNEKYNPNQGIAFAVLIIGGVLISIKSTKVYWLRRVYNRARSFVDGFFGEVHAEDRPMVRLLGNSVASALCFSTYYVLMKYIYMTQPFIGGFVWSRLGTFIGVMLFLLIPGWRKLIFERQRGQRSPENIIFFVGVRVLAAAAFIMLNWAISLGNVAMVNALQGVQYVFLIFLVLLLSSKYPKILKEELGRGVVLQKAMGVALVSLGLYLLVI